MNEQFNRRLFLASFGFGAVAASAAGQAANAQQASLKIDLSQRLKMDPKILDLQLADPRATRELTLTKRLAKDTPITRIFLTREAQAVLTSGARELTKADLELMADGKIPEGA